MRGVLADLPSRVEREPVLAAGKGGDDTTAIDAAAERAILARFDSYVVWALRAVEHTLELLFVT